MTKAKRPPPGMVDIADTIIDEVDALGPRIVFDVDADGKLVKVLDTREPTEQSPRHDDRE